MAVSKVEIANMALLKLGQSPIMSLSDDSPSARRASQEIDPALETVLRCYPWPFAVVRVELPRLSERPVYEFDYYYNLPADIMRIISMDLEGMPYDIEGQRLATSAEKAFIKYVSKDNALDRMDMQVKDVVALELAKRLAIITTENLDMIGFLSQQFERQLAQARNTWAVENMPQAVIEGGWIPARYGARGREVKDSDLWNPWGADGKGVTNG